MEAEGKTPQAEPVHPNQPGHYEHYAHMAADFRKRFWISLVLTLPIVVLSPMLQSLLGLREATRVGRPFLTPVVGAVLMAGSTVIVAINARMLRLKSAPEPPKCRSPRLQRK